MRIRRIDVRAFGGISDCRVDLAPGMNVVLGDNETGKSTIYRALEHTLLSPTNLDKRRLAKDLGPYLPRPGGNAAECTVVLEQAGEHTIRRRWGEDAEEELRTPDGTLIRGAADVIRAMERTLPVTPATFRAVFLADQSRLDRTIETLAEHPEARDEAAQALRSIRLETGGVSPDAFARLLDERIEALLGRWDVERDRPQDGRDYRNPWTRGAGELVKAHYEVQQLEDHLAEIEAAEDALDAAQHNLDAALSHSRELAAFAELHEPAFRELAASRGLDGEIAALEERQKRLREANRAWPVAARDAQELSRQSASLLERRAEREAALARARARDEGRLLRSRLARVDDLLSRLGQAEAERDAIPEPDPEAVAELRAVEHDLPYAEARLTTGALRVEMRAETDREVTIARDGLAAEPVSVGNEPAGITAARQVVLAADGLTIRVEAGEEAFDDVRDARDALLRRRDELCRRIGVQSAAEAESRSTSRAAAERRVREMSAAVAQELGEADGARLRAARDRLAAELPEPEDAPVAGEASATETADSVADLREQIAQVESRLDQAQATLALLAGEYGDQDRLENELGETSSALAERRAERDSRAAVPRGFDTADAFISVYEENARERRAADEALAEARVAYAKLVGSQPEQTSEEARSARDEAVIRFERLRRDARALVTVKERSQSILEGLDASAFDPFVTAVAGYLSALTGNAYAADPGEDPLAPARYRREDGPVLPYGLLSQGTKDSVALAVRLALAQTVLGDDSAPVVLDDPFVDMDPQRRRAAAAVVSTFAVSHQVILFTCHPDHAALFGDAHTILLGA